MRKKSDNEINCNDFKWKGVKELMINTHKIIGENIYKYADNNKRYLIKKKFIWGNIKPDCTPKYKKVRHYYDESIDMIIDKILYLSSLSLDEIYNEVTIGKFSEELGVVCHFLCDFFTAPHYYRWECKSTRAAKHHMMYENKLAKVVKGYEPIRKTSDLKRDDVKKFITILQMKYDGTIDCKHDLYYAYHACDSIVNMILQCAFNKKFNNLAL